MYPMLRHGFCLDMSGEIYPVIRLPCAGAAKGVHVMIRFIVKLLLCALVLLPLPAFATSGADTGPDNRLLRMGVRGHGGFTRLSMAFERDPAPVLHQLSGNRVRLVFSNTAGGRWKKLRSYRDAHVEGVVVAPRGNDLMVTVTIKGDPRGVRVSTSPGVGVVSLDVGASLAPRRSPPLAQGREGIKVGVEQLITTFDPPFKSEIPFTPTDRRVLEAMVPPAEVALISAGEAALYEGNGSEAAEIFAGIGADSPGRPLALYRLGEASYLLQKYGDALRFFREAERQWPVFLTRSPATAFCYADSVARSGDLAGGRRLLGSLIAGLADKKYAPALLVRMADILARQGKDQEAMAIYRNVADNFTGSKGSWQARMKLADRRLLALEPAAYSPLVKDYLEIYERGTDFGLREQGLFKAALLLSLYGDADQAFGRVAEYEKKFPRGMYVSIAKGMREELLVPVYRRVARAGDNEALVKLALENRDYLGRVLAEDDFIKNLSAAFGDLGRIKEEVGLYANLAIREQNRAHAPELYRRILHDAEQLGDPALMEKAAGEFVERFPAHPWVQRFREELAAVEYNRGDFQRVVGRLSGMLASGTRPEYAESLYYLGKSLDAAGNRRDAERAMLLFLAELRRREMSSPLAADASYVAATARLSRGDRKGAKEILRAAGEASPEERDPFLYKLGEIARSEGRYEEAAHYLRTVVKEGKDPDWRDMASRLLADMELTGMVRKSK